MTKRGNRTPLRQRKQTTMITFAEETAADILELDDLYARLLPFRIFRVGDYKSELKPVCNSPEWIMSTKLFPARFVKAQNLYNSELVKVARYYDNQSQENVAIKFIRKLNPDSNVKLKLRQDRINRELFILNNLHHPYIVNVREVLSMVDCYAIVMEFVAGGELFDLVQKSKRLSEMDAKRLMFQIFLAVDYLHSKGIVHRDLKLENILLDDRNQIKIVDFGFANILADELQILKTSCGSPCYAAPEIVLDPEGYKGAPVDVWSCGVIMFAMLFGHLPFEDQANAQNKNSNRSSLNVYQLYKYIATNQLCLPTSTKISPEAADLLKGLLNRDPIKRLTLTQIFRHLWFANASKK